MFRNGEKRPLFVCSGLQGSGSTLLSWCFLQHPWLDGILDGAYFRLPDRRQLPAQANWYKNTIAAFRASELIRYFSWLGYRVEPLLVVRDVRRVWCSLLEKPYGRNGVTAVDPPLRLRFRRFLEDWRLFRNEHLPILRWESFVEEPERVLESACDGLGLPFSEDMVTWPKTEDEILDTKYGSPTFWARLGDTLDDSLRPEESRGGGGRMQSGDRRWLDSTFAEYNEANGYAGYLREIPHESPDESGWRIPTAKDSRPVLQGDRTVGGTARCDRWKTILSRIRAVLRG